MVFQFSSLSQFDQVTAKKALFPQHKTAIPYVLLRVPAEYQQWYLALDYRWSTTVAVNLIQKFYRRVNRTSLGQNAAPERNPLGEADSQGPGSAAAEIRSSGILASTPSTSVVQWFIKRPYGRSLTREQQPASQPAKRVSALLGLTVRAWCAPASGLLPLQTSRYGKHSG
jgi:hypothetical protein